MALPYKHQFEAIGTPWVIETARPLSVAELRHIDEIIDTFDRTYSRFHADSLVSRARTEAPGSFTFPSSIIKLYDMYARLERATAGAVSPLVGDALEHWGYDAQYSLRPSKIAPPRPSSLAETISLSGSKLTYHMPALLDIGAIGKGYLIDVVAGYVAQHHEQYVIDAGGDMALSTSTPYRIGLEHPVDFSQVIGTVSLHNKSICGSSPNRRAWGQGLHHILDATTGKPTDNNIIATWAIADTTMLADALATALFFVPAATLRQDFGDFRHVIMRADASIEHTVADIGTVYVDAKQDK